MTDDLFKMAKDVSQNAYAPYSKFKVGVVIRSDSGKTYQGVNTENASYSCVQCAEGNAIAAMVAGGDKKIAEILIYPASGSPGQVCSPCGACRQKIVEFSTQETQIHYCTNESFVKTVYPAEMLPDFFGPSNL